MASAVDVDVDKKVDEGMDEVKLPDMTGPVEAAARDEAVVLGRVLRVAVKVSVDVEVEEALKGDEILGTPEKETVEMAKGVDEKVKDELDAVGVDTVVSRVNVVTNVVSVTVNSEAEDGDGSKVGDASGSKEAERDDPSVVRAAASVKFSVTTGWYDWMTGAELMLAVADNAGAGTEL
ncbi:MAG: hypothetical protein SEPTF4163_004832 [Sporothrix epigloea]